MAEGGRLRIGELSRRVGVSPELLRAWETRYGLVDPERTPGGLRLYSSEDERRVREMRRQIATGLSAAEAARVALRPPAAQVSVEPLLSQLDRALTALDEPTAQATLDHTFESLDLETALGQVILPFLHDLGERWATAERSVGQEHFASNVIGGRLRTLARGWGDGGGLRALLACPPGEQHELGLLCFGLLLCNRGWRIAYLGAETPTSDIATAIAELSPELVVLGSIDAQRFLDAADGIRELRTQARLAIGGAGASEALARSLGAELLADDLMAAARALTGDAP
ncbi:MAG: cobalamin B12-binding domain-containing protein [Actinomycetota bacterium]|jgi:DNA-binding transcriptional MerR regulator|nr:cobalamin B12-binding domain-containing protein [Actinomycetota bacterium]MDQ3319029.1 cobalamin B12-binding domain-containing protein [Actinomycetota bacterium]